MQSERKHRRIESGKSVGEATDELPPHREEAEWGLIVCAIEKPEIISGIEDRDFYMNTAKVVFRRIVEMSGNGMVVNAVTVSQSFIDNQPVMMRIAQALAEVVSCENWPYWLDICRSYKIARSLLAVRADLVSAADEVIRGGATGSILEISRKLNDLNRCDSGVKLAAHLADEVIQRLEQGILDPDSLKGVQTPFRHLNRVTWGLHAGDMIVIAARPGVGKSAFAGNIVGGVAVDQNIPVGVFSLEMTASKWVERLVAGASGVSMSKIRYRTASDREIVEVGLAAGRIGKAPLFIWDDISEMQGIYSKAMEAVRVHGLKLVVIDYLQRVQWKSGESRWQQVGNISSAIKSLAMEAKVPVLALAQISREVEKDGRMPRLSDLRESGSIEQDADLVGFLHPESSESEVVKPVSLLIAKNRNGESQSKVKLSWKPSITKFTDAIEGETDYENSGKNPIGRD